MKPFEGVDKLSIKDQLFFELGDGTKINMVDQGESSAYLQFKQGRNVFSVFLDKDEMALLIDLLKTRASK